MRFATYTHVWRGFFTPTHMHYKFRFRLRVRPTCFVQPRSHIDTRSANGNIVVNAQPRAHPTWGLQPWKYWLEDRSGHYRWLGPRESGGFECAPLHYGRHILPIVRSCCTPCTGSVPWPTFLHGFQRVKTGAVPDIFAWRGSHDGRGY